jgi:hypothetical protein
MDVIIKTAVQQMPATYKHTQKKKHYTNQKHKRETDLYARDIT